ncbi:MAG: murein biosynthesis integral membrane protein MurJ [Caldilineaceae bacterium]
MGISSSESTSSEAAPESPAGPPLDSTIEAAVEAPATSGGEPGEAAGAPGLARSASVLAAGNLASRVLGLVREMLIAAFFGASGQVSAYRVAAQVPILIYDFLIGGMLSAALVPVLSDYARRGKAEFTQVVSALATIFALVLALLVLLLELAAPQLAWLLAGGFATQDPGLLQLTAQIIRLVSPMVWLLSMGGVTAAVLYALQRFTVPAFATAVFNLGVVVAVPLLAPSWGIYSLVVGLLLGSGTQLAMMTVEIRRRGVKVRPTPNWRHPALRRILWLYLPIAAGLVVSLFQVGLDRRLASGTGESSIAWMANATTLQQMPLGLISVAISLAALPRLSQYFAAGNEDGYRTTLARGLRMLWLLIAPSAALLWLLGTPITRVLFQHGAFTAQDTVQVVAALNIYLIGMVFAALDYPLNFAFYARNNTLLPALVGVASVAVYTVVALTLVQPLGYLGLVWADTAKQASHLAIMAFLLWRRVGRLGAGTLRGLFEVAVATGLLAVVAWGVAQIAGRVLPSTLPGSLLLIAAAAGAGLVVYAAFLFWRGQAEIKTIFARITARFHVI